MTQQPEPYTTSDLYLAAFLCMQGMTLLGVLPGLNPKDPKDPKRFVLVDTPERDRLVEEWVTKRGDAGICRKYVKFFSMAKTALYGDKK